MNTEQHCCKDCGDELTLLIGEVMGCEQCLENRIHEPKVQDKRNKISNTEQLSNLIKELAGNTIFSVDFVKRSNGEKRTMVCRLGVKKGQVGGELPFDPVVKRLLPVYDMQKSDYRMINLDTVTEIRAGGNVYRFDNA